MKRTIILKQTLPSPLSFKGSLAGSSVPNTSTTAGDTYIITSAGTSQTKTWAIGDLAIYNGTSGSWSQVSGLGMFLKVAMPTATADAGAAGQFAVDSDHLAIYVSGTGWVFFDATQI